MKRSSFALLLTFSYCFCFGQNVDSTLVAYWPFDGNTNDTGDYGNHGVAFGVPVYAPGISGQALVFDGQDDYVMVPGTLPLHNLSTEYTFAGWVKPFGLPNFYVPIVTKGNTTDMRTPLAVLYRSLQTTPYIRTCGNDLPFDLINIESVTNACPLNEWTFFTWTFKLGKFLIYKNAALIAEQEFGFTELEKNLLPMDIGRDVPGFNTEWLHGMLDEMCVFNRALSNSEIYELHRSKSFSATNEIGSKAFIQLYPNPASQKAVVVFAFEQPGKVAVEVFNPSGQLFQTSIVESYGETLTTIDIQNLPDGVYRVCLKNDHERLTKNLLVLKK